MSLKSRLFWLLIFTINLCFIWAILIRGGGGGGEGLKSLSRVLGRDLLPRSPFVTLFQTRTSIFLYQLLDLGSKILTIHMISEN